jgi:hypothetical protein
MMLTLRIAILSAAAFSPAVSMADCRTVDLVASEAYKQANAALGKKWTDSARTSASIFWFAHGLEECPFTKTMATYMTQAGLGRGTEPTGTAATKLSSTSVSLSVPPGTVFVPATVSNVTGAVVPETVIVNGVRYKKSVMENGLETFDSGRIDKFLKGESGLEVKGIQVDKKYLERWKPLLLEKPQQ